jgi:hypothetical protein
MYLTSYACSDDSHSFSRRLVERLLNKLEEQRLPHLSETEQAHLIVMIQTTLEVCLCYNTFMLLGLLGGTDR